MFNMFVAGFLSAVLAWFLCKEFWRPHRAKDLAKLLEFIKTCRKVHVAIRVYRLVDPNMEGSKCYGVDVYALSSFGKLMQYSEGVSICYYPASPEKIREAVALANNRAQEIGALLRIEAPAPLLFEPSLEFQEYRLPA